MAEFEIKQIEDSSNRFFVEEILHNVNNDFKPPLDKRININDYTLKLYKNAIIYYAIKDSLNIGFIAFYRNNQETKIAYVPMIAIMSEFRGQGIGSKLLDIAIAHIKNNGFRKIEIETWEGSKAIFLYQKKGFKITKIQSDRIDGIRSVKMELSLNKC